MLLSQRGLILIIDCKTVAKQAVDAFEDFITHAHAFFELNVIFCKSIKAWNCIFGGMLQCASEPRAQAATGGEVAG